MKRVYFSDFDGTITKIDSTDAMVHTFAKNGWQKYILKWGTGELSTQECTQEIFRSFHPTKKELASFLDTIPIDETFKTFINYVNSRNEYLYILSDGFDFNIDIILKKAKINNLKIYSNHLIEGNNSYNATYPYASQCGKCGTCKKDLIHKLKGDANEIIYIGDGYSDICACQCADIIFAKEHLLKYCQTQGIPVNPYNSFDNIIVKLLNNKQ